MERDTEDPAGRPPTDGGSDSPQPLAPAALARRRLLLKGIGKGGAVLAAAAPIRSHALTLLQTGGTPNRQCTASGIGSVLHSGQTGLTTCAGRSTATWASKVTSTTPSISGSFGTGKTPINNFNLFFPTSGQGAKLIDVIQNKGGNTGSANDRLWGTALLNAACSGLNSINFPYTVDEVVGLYTTNKTGAEALFSGYLQTL